jgi:hypothetical protein
MSLSLMLEREDLSKAASEINLDAGKWYQKKADNND